MLIPIKAIGFLLLIVLCLFQTGWAFRLPDTGQQACYDLQGEILCPQPGEPFYGQDAQYHGPELTYQDNGDGTVTDLNTGLIWQKSTADIDEDGQITSGDFLNWQDACDLCNELTVSGHSGFRLPSRRELLSIVDYGKGSFPVINSIFNCLFDHYWSGSSHAIYPPDEWAWYVGFSHGYSELKQKRTGNFVRCVRGETIPTPTFIDNQDGTVTDEATGLMWQKSGDGHGRIWQDALCYCESLELAGYADWRLPNIRELESLVDWDRYDPAIDPVFESHSFLYWSGTTQLPGSFAWGVNFNYGRVGYSNSKGENLYVRCVRSSQLKTDNDKAIPSIILLLSD